MARDPLSIIAARHSEPRVVLNTGAIANLRDRFARTAADHAKENDRLEGTEFAGRLHATALE